MLRFKIAEVQASSTLDEKVASTLLDLYRRASTNLEMTRAELDKAKALAEAAELTEAGISIAFP